MFVSESAKPPARMKFRQKIENVFVEKRIAHFDGRMHRDAIAFRLEEMAGEKNARRNPHTAMKRRPALRALDGKIQFGPWICACECFAHFFAVEPQLRNREHAVGIDPGI